MRKFYVVVGTWFAFNVTQFMLLAKLFNEFWTPAFVYAAVIVGNLLVYVFHTVAKRREKREAAVAGLVALSTDLVDKYANALQGQFAALSLTGRSASWGDEVIATLRRSISDADALLNINDVVRARRTLTEAIKVADRQAGYAASLISIVKRQRAELEAKVKAGNAEWERVLNTLCEADGEED